ncbi:hypothetical protein DsansV1_C46g0242511 [Dioscorea sansibarensis]
MWLLTVRSGTLDGRDLTRRMRVSGLWTWVELRTVVMILAKAPTATKTTLRGRPARCSALAAHLIIVSHLPTSANARADRYDLTAEAPSEDIGHFAGRGWAGLGFPDK